MRCLRLVVLVAVAAWSSACFQMTTVLKVRGDGAGTIEHRMVYSTAALEKLRQFASIGGGRGGAVDPLSEQQAREMATAIGPGVLPKCIVPSMSKLTTAMAPSGKLSGRG